MSDNLSLTISYKGTAYNVDIALTSTVGDLALEIYSRTNVAPSSQKLLFKGKKPYDESTSLSDAGLKNGVRVQLIGPTESEVKSLHAEEEEHQRKEAILARRAMMPGPKVRNTGSSSASSSKYRFHGIEPLAHLPKPDEARRFLTRLANDSAIQHAMRTYELSVGVLTELAPHEQPHLLGLNANSGQAIKLRIRTDRYDGFRLYSDVRRVLCHELAHNRWGDHDENFKRFNSQLNKCVTDYERAVREGSHTLGPSGPVYTPSSTSDLEVESEAQAHILGGSSAVRHSDTPDERRRLALEAAMRRLRRTEEELENSCGTGSVQPSQEEREAS